MTNETSISGGAVGFEARPPAAYPAIETAIETAAIAELFAALAAVQAELPKVEKTRTADVYNKERVYLYSYTYADLADVSAAIMPLLGKNGLAFITLPGRQDGKNGLAYWLVHSGGAKIGGFYELPETGNMQTAGGLLTYARRYLLCALTGVAAEEDVDARGDGQQRRPQPRARSPREAEAPAQRTAQRRQSGPRNDSDHGPGTDSAGPEAQARPSRTTAAGPPLPREEDHDSPGTATRPQVQKLNILLGELGYGGADQRAEKLALCSRISGRELRSSSELSFNEAHRAIDLIERTGKDYAALDAELIEQAGQTSAMRQHLPDGEGA